MDWVAEPPGLNLFRKSDIETAIRDAGFHLAASLPYKIEESIPERIHDSWRKYSEDDLLHRVVIFLGSRHH